MCYYLEDNTIYNNDEITNEYEKNYNKVPRADKINLKRGTKLKVEGVGKVWGNINKILTVEATNIMVLKMINDFQIISKERELDMTGFCCLSYLFVVDHFIFRPIAFVILGIYSYLFPLAIRFY